jgi:hypothetical protein
MHPLLLLIVLVLEKAAESARKRRRTSTIFRVTERHSNAMLAPCQQQTSYPAGCEF